MHGWTASAERVPLETFLDQVQPEDQHLLKAAIERAIERNDTGRVSYRTSPQQGARTLEMILQVISDTGQLFATVSDVSRAQAQAQGQRQELHRLRALEQIAEVFQRPHAMARCGSSLASVFRSVFGVDHVWIAIPATLENPHPQLLAEDHAMHLKPLSELCRETAIGDALVNTIDQVTRTGLRVQRDSTVNTDSDLLWSRLGIQGEWIQPIGTNGHVRWVLGMYQSTYPRTFSQEERLLADEMGDRIAEEMKIRMSSQHEEMSLGSHPGLEGVLPDFVFTFDQDGKCLETMQAPAVSNHFQKSVLAGATLWELIRAEDQHLLQEAMHRSRSNGAPEQVVHRLREMENERYFTAYIKALDKAGAASYLCVHREISEIWHERKQADDRQRTQSLGLLAGGIAHDFNNILATILGNTEFALTEVRRDDSTREAIEDVSSAAHKGAEICQQLLAYSGYGPFRPDPVSLPETLRSLVGELEKMVPGRTQLSWECPEECAHVLGEEDKLRLVLTNIVRNAFEALDGQSGEVHVSAGETTLDQKALEASVVGGQPSPGAYGYIEVRDSGRGMDPETCARIFEPFYTTKFAGRGLGLAVVVGILRRHGGALTLASEPGRGTCIRVYLPCMMEGSIRAPLDGRYARG